MYAMYVYMSRGQQIVAFDVRLGLGLSLSNSEILESSQQFQNLPWLSESAMTNDYSILEDDHFDNCSLFFF